MRARAAATVEPSSSPSFSMADASRDVPEPPRERAWIPLVITAAGIGFIAACFAYAFGTP